MSLPEWTYEWQDPKRTDWQQIMQEVCDDWMRIPRVVSWKKGDEHMDVLAYVIPQVLADVAFLEGEVERAEGLARERGDALEHLATYAVHRHNDCWQTGRCICGLDDVLYEAGIEPVIRLTAAQGEALKRIMAGAEPDRRAMDADRPVAEGSQDASEEATRGG